MSLSERPNIKPPLSKIDLLFVYLGYSAIIFLWTWVIVKYPDVEDQIPVHFNGLGEVDRYADKSEIFSLVSIASILYIGLDILRRFPRLFNYPVKITQDNALKHYKASVRLLIVINFLVAVIFAGLSLRIISFTNDMTPELGIWMLPIILGLIFIPIVIYLIYVYKQQSKGADS